MSSEPAATDRTPAAPAAPAELVTDFANSLDSATREDELSDAAGLRDWLAERGLLPAGAEVGAEELELAWALRAGVREALVRHHDGDLEAPQLSEAASRLPLRAVFDGDGARFVPVEDGASGAVAGVLAAVMASVADGTWPRLKICADDTCRWAFVDRSRNRSRTWCDMSGCGNRAKTRAYRSRHRAPAPSSPRAEHGDR